MATRKRWTPEQDKLLIDGYDGWKHTTPDRTDDQIFELLTEGDLSNRTKAAVAARYYELTNGKKTKPKQTNEHIDFLLSLELLRTTYEVTLIENQKLKKRIAELEQKEGDFDALTQIMDRARKLAFLGETGDMEKPRFKMDGNGNLERL